MARPLTDAGHAAEALVILDRFAGAAHDAERARVQRLVDALCTSELKVDTAKIERAATTFRMLAKRWTSGDIAAYFPDYVAEKKTKAHDRRRSDVGS
jgi:hypothetical protein